MSQGDADPFRFDARGRNWRTLLAVLLAWCLILIAWVVLGATLWLIIPFSLATLPALWDLWRDPRAGLRVSPDRLDWWFSGQHHSVDLGEITSAEFITRLDLSVRVRLRMKTGKTLRLPDVALPPHREFEAVLSDRGVPVVRKHFRLLG